MDQPSRSPVICVSFSGFRNTVESSGPIYQGFQISAGLMGFFGFLLFSVFVFKP
jgi:hypothetical protein